jgi:hypothetical protein
MLVWLHPIAHNKDESKRLQFVHSGYSTFDYIHLDFLSIINMTYGYLEKTLGLTCGS